MEQHNHSHVFRNQDVDRVMAQYGNKPSPRKKREIMDKLSRQRERFLAAERIRELSRSRQRGRSI